MTLVVLVKVIVDHGKRSEDAKSSSMVDTRNVKLIMEEGTTMSDLVRAALVNADLYDQYQCTNVTYHDTDFDEDVYISPISRVESKKVYKMMVIKKSLNADNDVVCYF